MRKLIGRISVDSGQLLIVDPCHLSAWKAGDYPADDGNDYDAVSRGTVGEGNVQLRGMVGVSTNDDGDYDVYVVREGGRVKKVEVIIDSGD